MCRLSWNLVSLNLPGTLWACPGLWWDCFTGRCVGLTTLPPSCADCLEIWWASTFLEPSGPVRVCNGIALPLPCDLAHRYKHLRRLVFHLQDTHEYRSTVHILLLGTWMVFQNACRTGLDIRLASLILCFSAPCIVASIVYHKPTKRTFVKLIFEVLRCLLHVSNPRAHMKKDGCVWSYGTVQCVVHVSG
jgi:hypothetical protein